ncbi:MAG: hypothetical protein ABI743_12920 [bacterium]
MEFQLKPALRGIGCGLILVAVGIGAFSLIFPSPRVQKTSLQDVTKPQTLTLNPSKDANCCGVSVNVYGYIDGKATVSTEPATEREIGGTFDIQLGGDWYGGPIHFLYTPENVISGEVTVAYSFDEGF